MKLISIILIFSVSIDLHSQINFVNTKKYYDGFYFKQNNVCYTYNKSPNHYEKNGSRIDEYYLNIKVLPTEQTLKKIQFDEEGLIVPINKHNYENYYLDLEKYDPDKLSSTLIKSESIPNEAIDTIYIVRKESIGKWEKRLCKNGEYVWCLVEVPITILNFQVIKDTHFDSTKHIDNLLEIDIELKEDDLITYETKRQILCPLDIDKQLINDLNESLIDFGYLEDKKRTKYLGEIKNAISKFQIDYSLFEGFIDTQTLSLLGVNF